MRYFKIIRPVSIIVLAFFLWSFGGIVDIAYAIKSSDQQSAINGQNSKPNTQPSVVSNQQTIPKSEEKFQKAIDEIGSIAEKIQKVQTDKERENEKKNLKTKRQELETLDTEIKKQFKETEDKIKNLPEVVKQRHRDFVKKYEENLNTLKTNLDAIEKSKTGDKVKAEVERTKEFLEKTKPPSKHKALDPNKLPHRTAEPTKREPRTKPEEFEKDSGQLSASSHQLKKPILVAANGPLAGLLNAVIPVETGIQTGYPIEAFGYDKLNNSSIGALNYGTVALGDSGTMLLALADPPTSTDLSETIEVQFTPEIMAKVQELGNNPVKIYEYVKNNFFFEPYYGSLKGAHETLLEKAGNDFDQASLLIALLRSSNVPARYVYGTIEVPIERVKKWLGVENETVAGEILASNGIPVSLIQEGGKISKARFEHVWVEALVSYDNYRGQSNSQNKTWIPLDPSFKQVQYTRGPDLKTIMNFDPNAFTDELKAHSTYNASDYSVSHVDEIFIQQKLQEYQNNLQTYVTNNIPNAKPQDLIGKFDILYEKFGILPATLSYKIIVKGATYSEIPDALRHKLQINIKSVDYFDFFGAGDINYQINLSQLAGKKITISYLPATTADENTLKSYGSLSVVPAYLVNMKPVLMIDGVSVASGGEIGLGKTQTISLTFLSPNISTDIVTHNLTSGGYHAIGLNLQRIPKALLQKQTERMTAMKTYLESILSGTPSTPQSGDSRDNLLGDMLYDVAINYFYNLDAMNDLTSRLTDMMWVRQPSEAMVFTDLKVNSMFGIPLTAKPVGMSIDVSRNIISPFSMNGDKNIEKAFKMQSGMYTSAMEHIIFEWVFNVNAVSAVKVLQQANTLSIPVYAVTSQNIGQVLPLLQVSSDVKSDIQNAVNAGMTVIIPKTEITLNNWTGSGYIIQNPTTLAGAYMISGGINGGSTTDGIICYTCGCSVISDWEMLLDDIDSLLSLANALLLGRANIQALADEICMLLLGIDPSAPGAFKAEGILKVFMDDVAHMVLAITATQIPIWTSPKAVVEWLAVTIWKFVLTGSFPGKYIPEIYQYSGYFIMHYLYEYVVLFRAGLLDAFPENF